MINSSTAAYTQQQQTRLVYKTLPEEKHCRLPTNQSTEHESQK
ncbi:hypothetical protein DERF_002830 [Dermatophagoides farinae]|uniref:Uncharacterized protein n=1 Tax=Dermatophagoides farinae TaxID=6954 RepID=A0A922LAZ9_DERFA|nr:hypothetical protein DERF_002830 [Dermatophagoides farinae]